MNCTVHHGDCFDILPTLPDQSVDAVITDPPYMMGAASARKSADKAMGWADVNNAAAWFAVWYREVWRILRPAGCFWTFCNWRSFPVVSCAMSKVPGMSIVSTVVWDKQWPSVGSTRGLRQHYELIILSAKPDFAIENRSVPDIWPCKWTSHKPSGHPAEKPVALIERMIEVSGLAAGATIVDPFTGSGAVGIGAARRGCQFIGMELEQTWACYARKEIALAYDPLAEMVAA